MVFVCLLNEPLHFGFKAVIANATIKVKLVEKTNNVYSKSTPAVIDDEVWTSCCDVMTSIGIGQ